MEAGNRLHFSGWRRSDRWAGQERGIRWHLKVSNAAWDLGLAF
jgi:hypothetical protein